MPAVANAVYAAVGGAHRTSGRSSGKVLAALRKKPKAKRRARAGEFSRCALSEPMLCRALGSGDGIPSTRPRRTPVKEEALA